MTPRPRILFVSRQRLVGPVNGSSAYLIDLARAARNAGFEPHLLQPAPTVAGRWPVLRLRPEMRVFASHHIRGLIRVGDTFVSPRPRVYADVACALAKRIARRAGMTGAWTRDTPHPYAIAIPWQGVDHRFVRRHGTDRSDVVIADYVFCTDAFADLPGRPTATLMHDLFHAREGGGADSVAALTREREIELLGRADAVLAIQPDEATFVAENVADTRAIVVPMAAQAVAAPQPGTDNTLLFVGSNTAPNVVGLQWFFDHVWPAIHAADPCIRLQIAGSVAHAFAAGGPAGTQFLGLVPDLEPLYADAGLVISPLTFGSGLKIKLIEALTRGKAVVATPVTLQGVPDDCRDAVVETDDPSEMAAAIVRLSRDADARARLAHSAWLAGKARYAPEGAYREFLNWLDQVTAAT
jgi:glycosyltransferase involved in cell wall biosynthesis